MYCRLHTIRALSALDYLNLDPCSVSTVCMCGALLDEEKVKCFVEKTFVEDASDVSR